jgi:ribosomal protein S18 acetylase RimI-like enzyme
MTVTVEVEVRPATSDDVAVMAVLAEEAVGEQLDSRGGSIWSRKEARALPAADDLLALVAEADRHGVVGTIDGTIIGYATSRRTSLRDGALVAVVDDLYVDPGCRGVGVGELMMDALVDAAGVWGCIGIETTVLPGNRDTKNFFESFGLVARSLTVHKSL